MCYTMFMAAIDNLILKLISAKQQASAEELAMLITHVVQAPFATYLSNVPTNLRQLLAQKGIAVPARLPSLERHLLKRIYDEQQWPIGTTAEAYIDDLHQPVAHPNVQIWTYRYFGQPFAGFLAPSHVQQAHRPESHLYVVYSPEYQTLTTGYQASGSESIFTGGYTDLVRQK